MTHETTNTTVRTIELIDGYDRKKNPTKRMFRVLTLEEIRAWAVPEQTKCTCNDGTFQITVSDIAHADRLMTQKGIECNAGDIVTLDCQCKQDGHAGIRYRDITPSHVWFIATDGKARQAKVNGKVRTWKKDLTRVELPFKYGMYEYGMFDTQDILNGRVLVLAESK